jgi:DNA-binding MarR family transcriptional regulator
MHEQGNPEQPSDVRRHEPVRAYGTMNTVRALECLAFAPRSAPELAESLKVSVRTARRLLQRLALEGFVIQEGGHRRRYHATLRLSSLGRQLLDHAPLARAAAPRVARLAEETSSVAHFWISGYDEHVVCAVHADGRAGDPAVSVLREVASAFSSPAGSVLLRERSRRRSSCYVDLDAEPAFATAVFERGCVVAALGISGDRALDASPAVLTAAAQLSMELGSRPCPGSVPVGSLFF